MRWIAALILAVVFFWALWIMIAAAKTVRDLSREDLAVIETHLRHQGTAV